MASGNDSSEGIDRCIGEPLEDRNSDGGENANLPDVVEALHGRVSAGLFLGDESEMDSEKKMEPEDLGKAVTVSSPARGGHLVVHLRDPGKSHNLPRIKKMEDKGDGLLIVKLMSRDRLAGDVDRMDGVEPGESPESTDVTRSDQVGLLKIAHRPSSDVRIGRPIRNFSDFDLSGPSGSGQYLFDRRNGGERLPASFKELVMDRFGAGLWGKTGVPITKEIWEGREASPRLTPSSVL